MSRASGRVGSARDRRRAIGRQFFGQFCAVQAAAFLFASCGWAQPSLEFQSPGEASTSISLAKMRAACPAEKVAVEDPYHGLTKRYFAMPLVCVLDVGFAGEGGAQGLRGRGLILEALDGYTRPASGADLLAAGAYLAFGEVDLMSGPTATPRFSRIDRREIDPAPFYLVWTGAGQNDPHTHPWPYQLARIEVASFSDAFPATAPQGLEASDPGWAGYSLFQRSCASCHAINGEGGKVGPDLNVPMSIVEYRPIEQIKSYVRNPQATRYTSMPAHPDLSDADLDRLIAYFQAMSQRKRDPHVGAPELEGGT